MTDYIRVIPRDLFNEAKLLKCMGRLCLLVLDRLAPAAITYEENGEPFEIKQNPNDGGLFIVNLTVSINDNGYHFQTLLNSKRNYPLVLQHDDVDYIVFNEDGSLSDEFLTIIKSL